MGKAIASLDIPNRDGRTTSNVYVDKKGSIVDRPKWLGRKKKDPYGNQYSFSIIVGTCPWLEEVAKKKEQERGRA